MPNGDQKTLNTQDSTEERGRCYSKKTAGAKNAINSAQEILEKSIFSLSQKKILRFDDFASANGGTSQELWYNLIDFFRSKGDDGTIEIIYMELVSNDFSTLFM